MLCMEFSQVLMVIERTLATCLFVCYEKTTKTIGLVLTAVAVSFELWKKFTPFIPFSSRFYFPLWLVFTCTMTTSSITPRWVRCRLLRTARSKSITSSLQSQSWTFWHWCTQLGYTDTTSGKRTRWSYPKMLTQYNSFRIENHDHFILSSRFQINENVISARLLWWLSSAQLLIFLTYGCTMYSLRAFLSGPRNGFWQAITELCYVSVLFHSTCFSSDQSVQMISATCLSRHVNHSLKSVPNEFKFRHRLSTAPQCRFSASSLLKVHWRNATPKYNL